MRISAAFLALAFFASACTTSPYSTGRAPAQESPVISLAQLEEIERVGVEVMTLAMLSNRVARDAKIDAQLKARLAKIGVNGEPHVYDALVIGVATSFGVMGLTISLQLGALTLQSSFRFSEHFRDRMGSGAATIVFSSAMVGAGLSASESLGSSGSVLRAPLAKGAQSQADRERETAYQEFERQITATADRYARIFGLDGTRRVILEQELRSAVLAKGAKSSGSQDVTLNIPRLMAESGLIGNDQHEDFLLVVENLKIASRSEAAVDRLANADRFKPNLELATTALGEYVTWLRQARVGLDAEWAKVIDGELRRTERLLTRLKNL